MQIAADALGVSTADIRLVMGDTARTLDAGKTSASRQTFVTGKACELAALDLKAKLAQVTDRAVLRDLPPDNHGDVLTGYGRFDPPTTPLDANGQGVPYATYGFATQVALVEVDLDLGTVKVLRIVAAHDVGNAVNPTAGRRPDPRRHRAGHRPRADGGIHPRPHREPARLPDPDLRRHAGDDLQHRRGPRAATARMAPRASASRP